MSEEQRNNNLGIDISPSDPRYKAALERKLKELTEKLATESVKDIPPSNKEEPPLPTPE